MKAHAKKPVQCVKHGCCTEILICGCNFIYVLCLAAQTAARKNTIKASSADTAASWSLNPSEGQPWNPMCAQIHTYNASRVCTPTLGTYICTYIYVYMYTCTYAQTSIYVYIYTYYPYYPYYPYHFYYPHHFLISRVPWRS